MKEFLDIQFDPVQCAKELNEFRQLLAEKTVLSEQQEILPFFRTHTHLSAFLGCYHQNIITPNKLSYEYELFGDFIVDLVVGDSRKNAYCFIEFEDAGPDSIFIRRGRSVPDWSSRFDHGFSQIIDWFWKLDDFKQTTEFENKFGSRSIDMMAILVVGRDANLNEERERNRLKWRHDHVVVHSKKIYCYTFDQTSEDMQFRLEMYPKAADTE